MRWIHQDDDQIWRHDSHDGAEWCADGRPATPRYQMQPLDRWVGEEARDA